MIPSTSSLPSTSTSFPEAEITSEPAPSSSYVPTTSSALLEAEVYFLKQELEELKSSARGGPFGFKDIENSDELCRLYTGLPCKSFIALYDLLKHIEINYYFGWNVEKISKIDQLLMCLMKLRQNNPHADLAQRFRVSQALVSNVVITWIFFLHEILHEQSSSKIPSRKKNQTCLPNVYAKFTNCRIVLDCTEMAMAVPRTSMATQKMTYSSYKHKNTWKALVGVAPNGVITYVSSLYPGAVSDKKIVQDCGVLGQLDAGDLVLADKGFLIRDLLPSGVSLNIPPFLNTAQFTPAQIKQTESIARARIHVERAIQRMKVFKILNFMPHSLFPFGKMIFQVIGALTNLQNPLIEEIKNNLSCDSD